MSHDTSKRWLLFVHQLPTQPSKLRVKAWRRLQNAGAVKVKNSVYVLPNTTECREDFEWLRKEIVGDGGEAMILAADTVDDLGTDEIVESFVSVRAEDWQDLLDRANTLRDRLAEAREATDRGEANRELKTLRNRFAQVDKLDFFQAPGRSEALEALDELTRALRPAAVDPSPEPAASAPDFSSHRWLTRPHPGVDRMASAWLIRSFVDPEAEFHFAEEVPPKGDTVPFDMFGVALGHQADRCTFETLLATFELDDPALARMARIVHDLDLRKDAPNDSETSTIGRLVFGLREQGLDDAGLLESGITLFDALYRSFRSELSGR